MPRTCQKTVGVKTNGLGWGDIPKCSISIHPVSGNRVGESGGGRWKKPDNTPGIMRTFDTKILSFWQHWDASDDKNRILIPVVFNFLYNCLFINYLN